MVAHDLRTGIALILAGLGAEGETVVAPGYLIDRGHAAVARAADHPGRRHHASRRAADRTGQSRPLTARLQWPVAGCDAARNCQPVPLHVQAATGYEIYDRAIVSVRV